MKCKKHSNFDVFLFKKKKRANNFFFFRNNLPLLLFGNTPCWPPKVFFVPPDILDKFRRPRTKIISGTAGKFDPNESDVSEPKKWGSYGFSAQAPAQRPAVQLC